VVSFTPPIRIGLGGWMGPRVCLNAVVKRTKFHLFHRRELSPDRLSRSLVSILTELSRLLLGVMFNYYGLW